MAFVASALLFLAACAPPANTNNTANETPVPSASPSPSPSPTPPAPLELASAPFHNGEIGLAYTGVTLVAAGGSLPYEWSATGLPPGLTLGSDGSITGTPTRTGTFTVTAIVADAAHSGASRRATVTVFPAMRTTQVCAVKCQIGAGCSRCGGFGTVAGGMPPYRYAVVGGSVPQGMTWKALSLAGPFPAGAFSLHVQVTDALGAQTTVVGNWVIYKPATLVKGTDCIQPPPGNGLGNGPHCNTSGWSYSGGSPFSTPKVVIAAYGPYCTANGCQQTPTSPPPSWSVTIKNGLIAFSAGNPSCSVPTPNYAGVLTLELVDTSQCAASSPSNKVNMTVFIQNQC